MSIYGFFLVLGLSLVAVSFYLVPFIATSELWTVGFGIGVVGWLLMLLGAGLYLRLK